ncbi:hypothetical protein [Pseudomonas sp. LF052]
MQMPVDRPYPVDYDYQGFESKIDFAWRSNSDSVPEKVRVQVKDKAGEVQNYQFSGNFVSYEDALEEGKKSVRDRVDREIAR